MPIKVLVNICIGVSMLILGCTTKEMNHEYLEMTRYEPREILRFDQVGEHYLGFIGTQSIVLCDGSFILVDRDNPKMVQVSPEGKYLGIKAVDGRGPGEIKDIIYLSRKPDFGFLAYDQRNRKILEFDNNANFIAEFVVPPAEGGTLIEAYLLTEDRYLLVYRNLQQYLTGVTVQPTVQLVLFDKTNETIIKSIETADALMATHIQDGIVRGGRRVDYGPLPLRSFDSNNRLFYSFWSGGNKIAQLDQNLDTLQSLNIRFQTELLASVERDSLRSSMPVNRWRELEPLLPQNKALAQEMLIDSDDQIWLQLNHRSSFNEWLVIDKNGNSLYIVLLPKGSFLTHISNHHLGVRLDDGTFALFESGIENWLVL